jgi:hypothetical protein
MKDLHLGLKRTMHRLQALKIIEYILQEAAVVVVTGMALEEVVEE